MTEATAIFIDCTNYKGERSWRRILPLHVHWGRNQWHPEPQWLLVARDLDKGGAERDFAMKDIHEWKFGDQPPETAPPTVPELLADYAVLLNKHGADSDQAFEFANAHHENVEFIRLAETARLLKGALDVAAQPRVPLSQRRAVLCQYLTEVGSATRGQILAATRIPPGTLSTLLNEPEFENHGGMWRLRKPESTT